MQITMELLEGDYEAMGFETIEGLNPGVAGEIALGVNVARTLDKAVGDQVDVYVYGEKQTATVTGIFQSVMNYSDYVRMKMDAFANVSQAEQPFNMALIFTKEAPDQLAVNQAVVDDLNATLGSAMNMITKSTQFDSIFRQMSNTLLIPMAFIGLLFCAVTFIIIYSTCLINMRKESRNFGIYKSIGMTSGRIRFAITLGIVVLAVLGAVVGVALGIYVLPQLLNIVLSGMGLVDFPLVLGWSGIVLMAVVSIVAAGLGSWASSRMVRRTSPRMLAVE
jgi:putative ABC transport system permease protein